MAEKKSSKKRVDVKDLDAKARQMKLRGGAKSLGAIGNIAGNRPTQLE